MRKSILLAVLAVALLAVPAHASVQNIKISGDIETTFLVRDQFDLGATNPDDSYYQNLLITFTRLRVDADLTDNVSATVALLNERAWGEDNENGDGNSDGNNDIDLNLAFVTLREMLYSPLTVVIGRQAYAFGNSFVIDSAGSNNTVSDGGLRGVAEDLTKRTAQDAVRLILDYNPLTIDLVAAKIEADNLQGAAAQDDDVDLFGTNANYQLGDDWDSVVEGYFWARIDQRAKDASALGPKSDNVYMPGIHVSTNPIKGLNVQGEFAWQFGNFHNTNQPVLENNIPRRALAGQFIANYALPFEETAQWNPVITGVYTYTSGDSGPEANKNPNDQNDEFHTAWDPMFENQGTGKIYNTLFDLTNSHIITISAQVNPIEDVTAILEWNGMWLDKELADHPVDVAGAGTCAGTDCLTMRQPDGSTLNPVASTDMKTGDEVDIKLLYDYTEDVQFGFVYGVFIPGALFHETNQLASQYLVNGIVNF